MSVQPSWESAGTDLAVSVRAYLGGSIAGNPTRRARIGNPSWPSRTALARALDAFTAAAAAAGATAPAAEDEEPFLQAIRRVVREELERAELERAEGLL